MTITQDYQVELPDENLLLGCGTDYNIRRSNSGDIQGIVGTPPVKIFDVETVALDGSDPGMEGYQTRQITIPVRIYSSNEATAGATVRTLVNGWKLIRRLTTPLDIRVPGSPDTVMRYYGRPREVSEDTIFRKAGLYEITLTFDAVDPYAYGEEQNSAVDSSSPITITNDGSVPSNRAVLHVIGNGGTPVITNTSDPDSGDVTFKDTLGVGVGVFIDLYNQNVTDIVGTYDSHIWINSLWFGLQPGNNVITFTGCASVQVLEYRSAWN